MLSEAQSNLILDLFKNCNSCPRVGAGGPGRPPLPGSGPVVQTVTRSCGQVYTRAQSVTALHRPQSRPESRTANTDRPARASQAAQSCEFSANPGVSDLAVCRLCAKLRPTPHGPRGDIKVVTP